MSGEPIATCDVREEIAAALDTVSGTRPERHELAKNVLILRYPNGQEFMVLVEDVTPSRRQRKLTEKG